MSFNFLPFADIILYGIGVIVLKIKKYILIGVFFAVVGSFWLYKNTFADTADPGSQQDPLVTKSYVDAKISQIQNSLQGWEIIYLKNSQSLILDAGTQIIVRGGKASIISGPDGLSDVTKGEDLKNGAIVPFNHLLITPRSDGRGIKAISDTVIVMVKGSYTVK
ncbi:hypothetical protein SAMN02746089_02535 [Caldanaerobius fijiensis DSM 17918]|uniref:Uncharacterized protein n=1 Tax=Caldanaerobius fijiensis DSM 17918 TaxID=1121256 RepID=A0A1M5EEV5_9THEO|nr:hypothetical protein SAMN02746089_02535 [Caldanaerobius fijiensis DSM 17918]